MKIERIRRLQSFALGITAALAAIGGLSPAAAQVWSIEAGGTARGEYSDNYFFQSTQRQSAFMASIAPYVSAVRRTERSGAAAFLSIGGNDVRISSSDASFATGRLSLLGSLRESQSEWSGDVSLSRDRSLQSALLGDGLAYVLATSSTGAASGRYTFTPSERWTVEASARAVANRRDAVSSLSPLQDDHALSATALASYAFAEQARLSMSTALGRYASDVTRTDSWRSEIGLERSFSPRLSASATLGAFVAWTDVTCEAPCAADTSSSTLSQPRVRRGGPLYGGNVTYAFSDRGRLAAGLASDLSASANGVLIVSRNAAVSVSRELSDRASGRLIVRDSFSASLDGSSHSNYVSAEIGVSYRLADHWTLDAGYSHSFARASAVASGPAGDTRSNVAYVTVSYDWAGGSLTDVAARGARDWETMVPESSAIPPAGSSAIPGARATQGPSWFDTR